MRRQRVTLLLVIHLLVFLAVLHLRFGVSFHNPHTVADIIPETLLQINIALASEWSAVFILACYTLLVLRTLYKAFFLRIEYSANTMDNLSEEQLGHIITPGRTKRQVANMMRLMRKSGKIPPIYPNGWYEVMRSEELVTGKVKAVSMVGEQFAVFRGENGQVSITDAYCPHLGAHLGVGGQVKGNCIECPFHGWQFEGETGECTKIPYAAKIPSLAKVKVWPSIECNGLILLWYDAEGRDPAYFIPEYDEIKTGSWTYKGRIVHYIPCHIQEIPENGGDVNHLNHLHHHSITSGSGVDFMTGWLAKLLDHQFVESTWIVCSPPDSHISRLTGKLVTKFLGFTICKFHFTANQVGPAIVHLKMAFPFGTVLVVQSVVPEKPLLQRMTNAVYSNWWFPNFIAQEVLRSECIQVSRDVMVWTHKTYRHKPLLVKEDQMILNHRRWYAQFYSENSPRLDEQNDKQNDMMSW